MEVVLLGGVNRFGQLSDFPPVEAVLARLELVLGVLELEALVQLGDFHLELLVQVEDHVPNVCHLIQTGFIVYERQEVSD